MELIEVDIAEEKINELEDIEIETMQTEAQREKVSMNRTYWPGDTIKCQQMCNQNFIQCRGKNPDSYLKKH